MEKLHHQWKSVLLENIDGYIVAYLRFIVNLDVVAAYRMMWISFRKPVMSISPYLFFCQHGLATTTSCKPFNLPVSSALFWLPTSLAMNPSSASFLYGGFLLHPQNCSPTAGFLGRWFLPYGVLPLFFQYTMDQTSIFWGFCSYKNGKTLLS